MNVAPESGAVLDLVQALVHGLASIMSERRRLRNGSRHYN
jgi:hypothetical protein